MRALSEAVEEVIETVRVSQKRVIIVTNEVGSGVVPAYALGRWYRDALGTANAQVAGVANAVVLMSVGLPQVLKGIVPEVAVDAP